MRSLVLVLVMGGCLLEAAAQPRFSRRYPTFGIVGQAEAWSVVELDNGECLAVISTPWDDAALNWSYSSVVTMLRVNSEGEQLSLTHFNVPYHATYPGWSNSAFRLADGSVMVGGSTFEEDGAVETHRPALFRISANGEPMGQWIYGATGEVWIGRQAKQAPDGGFVICGETDQWGPINNGHQADAFVLKTDAQGNLEWVQTYGLNNRFENFMSIDLAPDGGYYCGGRHTVAGSLTIYDQWVVRIDAQGQLLWQQTYGLPFHDPNAHLTTMADGALIWASGCSVDADQNWRPCLTKVSPTGQTLWSKMYGPGLFQTLFYVVQEVEPYGDLIAAGQSYVSNLVSEGYIHGLLLRTTSNGDSLWMRYYDYYDANVSDGRGYFRDVQPTSDGGFIAVGQALPVGPYTSDVWVVKTDSFGCLEPGCHLITGMETQITNLRGALSVAPNPVAHGAAVQVSIALPENFIPQGALRITVTDAMGRVVHEQLIGEAGHSELRGTKQEGVPASLTATQLPSGLYHLHLSDATRWISGAKLVVE